MGMCSAWAMTSPRASKMAVEQSWRSLMLVEYEDLMSAVPISSAMLRSAAPITSSVTRSTASRAPVADHEEAQIVDERLLPREEQRRRVELLDHRRPGHAVPGQQPRAVVHRAGDEAL